MTVLIKSPNSSPLRLNTVLTRFFLPYALPVLPKLAAPRSYLQLQRPVSHWGIGLTKLHLSRHTRDTCLPDHARSLIAGAHV